MKALKAIAGALIYLPSTYVTALVLVAAGWSVQIIRMYGLGGWLEAVPAVWGSGEMIEFLVFAPGAVIFLSLPGLAAVCFWATRGVRGFGEVALVCLLCGVATTLVGLAAALAGYAVKPSWYVGVTACVTAEGLAATGVVAWWDKWVVPRRQRRP